MLEDRLGTEVPYFCYPRGDVNEAVKRIVRDEGYRAACSTLPGLNDRRTDLFELRRTYISRRDTPPEFAKKMAGAYDLLQRSADRRGGACAPADFAGGYSAVRREVVGDVGSARARADGEVESHAARPGAHVRVGGGHLGHSIEIEGQDDCR